MNGSAEVLRLREFIRFANELTTLRMTRCSAARVKPWASTNPAAQPGWAPDEASGATWAWRGDAEFLQGTDQLLSRAGGATLRFFARADFTSVREKSSPLNKSGSPLVFASA